MLASCEDVASATAASFQDSHAVEVLGTGCAATFQSGASIVDNILNHEEIAPVHDHTTSVNRSYSDLHQGRFLLYAFSLCALRTAVQQPINLALARKQTSSQANAMRSWHLLTHIFRREGGWRAIGAGMPALTLGCALSEAIYLGLFECCREQLPIETDATRDGVAGYVSDVMCRVVHIPLSVIAFRQMTYASHSRRPHTPHADHARTPHGVSPLQLSRYDTYQRPHYRHPKSRAQDTATTVAHTRRPSALVTLRTLYRERGLRSVFAGFGTTLVVGCQWTALWWACYGQVKTGLYAQAQPALLADSDATRRDGTASRVIPAWARRLQASPCVPRCCLAADDNMLLNTIASIVTSATTAVLFNPYLVVRTNLQVTPNSTLWTATRDVWRTRGVAGFYSGLALSINACIIEGALASWSYEYAKLWSDKTRD